MFGKLKGEEEKSLSHLHLLSGREDRRAVFDGIQFAVNCVYRAWTGSIWLSPRGGRLFVKPWHPACTASLLVSWFIKQLRSRRLVVINSLWFGTFRCMFFPITGTRCYVLYLWEMSGWRESSFNFNVNVLLLKPVDEPFPRVGWNTKTVTSFSPRCEVAPLWNYAVRDNQCDSWILLWICIHLLLANYI